MEALIWILICIGYIALKFAKVAGKANTVKTAKPNVPRKPVQTKSTYTRNVPKQRSFAAMPQLTAPISMGQTPARKSRRKEGFRM